MSAEANVHNASSRRNLMSADVHAASRRNIFSRMVHEAQGHLISATLVDEDEVVYATQVEDEDGLPPPESEVERIVQRLELRNANRVAVPLEVKKSFLRLCNEACKKRKAEIEENEIDASTRSKSSAQKTAHLSPCLQRQDIFDV